MKKAVCIILVGVLLAVGVICVGSCSKAKKESTRYEVAVEFKPDDDAIAGTVKVDFYNEQEVEIDCLKFQLYPNAYRRDAVYSLIGYDVMTEAYYKGQSHGEMNISSVLGGAGFEIEGVDKNILSIELLQPVPPEGRVVVDIGFVTKLATVHHRLGVGKRGINFLGAFPVLCAFEDGEFFECVPSSIGSPFLSECAEYSVQLTVPKEYRLACAGRIDEEKTLESKKRYTVSALNLREMAFCISTEYLSEEVETGKTKIKYYHFGEKGAEEIVQFAKRAVEYYSSVFGEYPYDTLTIARTNVAGGAHGVSGLCLIDERLSGIDLVNALLKEIANVWWYDGVGVNRVSSAWLAEGLSAYSAALFLGKYSEYGIEKNDAVENARKEYAEFLAAYKKALGWVDGRMNRGLETFLNGYEYESVVEKKSIVMFADLEKSLGNKKMLAGLRRYYTENLYGRAAQANFVGAFERCGLDIGGFIEGYVEGKGTF